MTHEQFIEGLDDDSMLEVCFCVDCVYLDANGWEDGAEFNGDYEGLLPEWSGWVFGPVLTDEFSDPVEPHYVRPGTPCDGCGSTLGGDRWDYIAVPKHTIKKGE